MQIQLIAAPLAVLCNYIEFTYLPLALYFFSTDFGDKNRRIHLNEIKRRSSALYSSLLEFFVDSPGFAQKIFIFIDLCLRAMQVYGVYQVVALGAESLGDASFFAMLPIVALPMITKILQLFAKELAHADFVATTAVYIVSLIYGFEGAMLSSVGHFEMICVLSF